MLENRPSTLFNNLEAVYQLFESCSSHKTSASNYSQILDTVDIYIPKCDY